MPINHERRAFLKERARYFAAGVIENIETAASGQFDDFDLSHEELLLIDDEMKAIGRRIWKGTPNADK